MSVRTKECSNLIYETTTTIDSANCVVAGVLIYLQVLVSMKATLHQLIVTMIFRFIIIIIIIAALAIWSRSRLANKRIY